MKWIKLLCIALPFALLIGCSETNRATSEGEKAEKAIVDYDGVKATKNELLLTYDKEALETIKKALKKEGAVRFKVYENFDNLIVTFSSNMTKEKFMQLKERIEQIDGVTSVSYNAVFELTSDDQTGSALQ